MQLDLFEVAALELESAISALEAEFDRLDSTGRDTGVITNEIGLLRQQLDEARTINERRRVVASIRKG